ncbi:MAG: hypothetical protein AAF502_09865 [Bacteroidota bacterium]
MDTFPLANLSVATTDDLKTLVVRRKGADPKKYSLESGITLKAQKRSLEVHQNNPVANTNFDCSFSIPKSGQISINVQVVISPERTAIIITDFNESLEVSASSSVNINVQHLQLTRRGDKLVVKAGTVRQRISPSISDTSR